VWVLAVLAGLVGAGALVLTRGEVALTRHRAASVADLAALAVASHADEGQRACSRGTRLAAASGAAMVACRVTADGSVDVAVSVTMPGPWAGLPAATVSARAGPAVVG
jgi:secretion/DNA translocation related TadE-like protein